MDEENNNLNMRTDAYNRLKYEILHGAYFPGQKKFLKKIVSQDLGIGRTPVREAIIRLERYSLVEVVPQSGTYVTRIDMKSAENAQFLRREIDPDILLEFDVKSTPEIFHRLEDNLDRQTEAARIVTIIYF
ncbi:GntR family transcriptional regulator [Paucilactobacillus hokkaidonensis]|uniref:GntR family transcriptional regulator n=1 Tax=Paucilactobacillus hokkaidonensis TaxID=1193095 RepID=UPI000B315FE7|nr:GntR family transcriptional regulator [Paucilactobacillus hokkaidonensis]